MNVRRASHFQKGLLRSAEAQLSAVAVCSVHVSECDRGRVQTGEREFKGCPAGRRGAGGVGGGGVRVVSSKLK